MTAVETDKGIVEADTVVLAAGLWTSELARMAGTSVALYPAEHVWVMTDPVPGAEERLPFLRDLDGYFYVRHHGGSLVVGAFEPKGKPKAPADVPTDGFAEFGEDWDHFAPVLAAARERLPVLEDVGFQHYLRGPESFSPDANLHLGEFPEVRRLFVAAGLNSQGIIYGPGVGKALAEWIVEGHPTMDLTEVDIARTGRWANNRAWLREKTHETLGRLYAMHWPAAAVRLRPRRAAVAVPAAAARGRRGDRRGCRLGARRLVRARRRRGAAVDLRLRPAVVVRPRRRGDAARPATGVALFDLSTYAKFLVQGPEARCRAAAAVHARTSTSRSGVWCTRSLCNERGGIEMDPTVTRLAEDRFLVLAPTLYQRRTEMLLPQRPATGCDRHRRDERLRDAARRRPEEPRGAGRAHRSGSLERRRSRSSRRARSTLGGRRRCALRVSFTGELGWELLVPTEFAADVFDKIVAAGAPHGMRLAGAFAFEGLRLERGFRSWGHDIGSARRSLRGRARVRGAVGQGRRSSARRPSLP